MTGLVDTEEADLRIRFDDAARDRLAGMLAQRPGGEAPGTGDAPGAGDEVAVGLYDNRLQEPGLVDRTGERGEVAEIVAGARTDANFWTFTSASFPLRKSMTVEDQAPEPLVLRGGLSCHRGQQAIVPDRHSGKPPKTTTCSYKSRTCPDPLVSRG